MKERIKSHIVNILMHNMVKKGTVQEIIQNNYRGTRAREVNLAITELIGEYKVELHGDVLDLTMKFKNEIKEDALLGIMYN